MRIPKPKPELFYDEHMKLLMPEINRGIKFGLDDSERGLEALCRYSEEATLIPFSRVNGQALYDQGLNTERTIRGLDVLNRGTLSKSGVLYFEFIGGPLEVLEDTMVKANRLMGIFLGRDKHNLFPGDPSGVEKNYFVAPLYDGSQIPLYFFSENEIDSLKPDDNGSRLVTFGARIASFLSGENIKLQEVPRIDTQVMEKGLRKQQRRRREGKGISYLPKPIFVPTEQGFNVGPLVENEHNVTNLEEPGKKLRYQLIVDAYERRTPLARGQTEKDRTWISIGAHRKGDENLPWRSERDRRAYEEISGVNLQGYSWRTNSNP